MKQHIVISTDNTLLQLDRIHRFLSEETYWAMEIPKHLVKLSIENSLCFGMYKDKTQIGFARVVSDYATFAWICDVYIERDHQGNGYSQDLMKAVMAHPQLQGLRRICLATKDAHGVYEKIGFEVTKTPKNWLEIKKIDAYKKNLI